jgi:hypothetical protein
VRVKILSGTGILGYGLDDASLASPDAAGLDLVGCDGGSTDPGPFYLGSAEPICPRPAVKRDLARLLRAARESGAPLVIGSCGGSGCDAQVDETFAIARELLAEEGLHARVARVRSELEPAAVEAALADGRIAPLDGVGPLDAATVRASTRIVAMMGPEPIAAALAQGAEIVLAGRCSDAALFAALPLARGVDPGTAWYAGKLLECGATCAEPAGPDSVVAELDSGSFTLYPPNPARRCTVASVSAMSLHENADPFLHRESTGVLDLTGVAISPLDERRVRVTGARFDPSPQTTVRLEGVRASGHRTVVVAATRDPRLIDRLEAYLDEVRDAAAAKLATAGIAPSGYEVYVREYGRAGVLGELEPLPARSNEVAVVVEVVAATQELSRQVASGFRSTLLHRDFPGRQCTEGNFALPFSPAELDGGPAYEFTIWHSLAVGDPLDLFRVELEEV